MATIGYKGHLDPPCNLIQEKTSDKRLLPLTFFLLNDMPGKAGQLWIGKVYRAEQYPLVSVTVLFKPNNR